jgi:hypothetical protein
LRHNTVGRNRQVPRQNPIGDSASCAQNNVDAQNDAAWCNPLAADRHQSIPLQLAQLKRCCTGKWLSVIKILLFNMLNCVSPKADADRRSGWIAYPCDWNKLTVPGTEIDDSTQRECVYLGRGPIMLRLTSRNGDEGHRREAQMQYEFFPSSVVPSFDSPASPCSGHCECGLGDSRQYSHAQVAGDEIYATE